MGSESFTPNCGVDVPGSVQRYSVMPEVGVALVASNVHSSFCVLVPLTCDAEHWPAETVVPESGVTTKSACGPGGVTESVALCVTLAYTPEMVDVSAAATARAVTVN